MEDFNVENDINIDKYNLEGECITMSSTYYKYADKNADAKNLISEKKDNLKVILAERSIAIRENLATSGVKVTEGIITSAVDADLEVRQARKELRDAEATYERLSVIVSSLEIKKSELDNLVKLRCNSMYVDSPSRPTKDIQADYTSEQLRTSMKPVPTKN